MDPEVETSNCMQDGNGIMADEFYTYVIGPREETPFLNYHIRTLHSESCAFRMNGQTKPCSCCVGSMTFATAENFVNTLLQQPSPQENVQMTFHEIPQTTMIGLTNLG